MLSSTKIEHLTSTPIYFRDTNHDLIKLYIQCFIDINGDLMNTIWRANHYLVCVDHYKLIISLT